MLDLRFAFLPVALFALACTESVESTDIRTTGIYPEIKVVATGNGQSEVTVWLKTGGSNSNTYLDLKGDDTLEVTVDGDTKTMDQSGDSYEATFDVDAGGTEFTIAFLRGDADEDAPESVVALPEPFEMVLGASTASRADDDLEYTWEPEGDGNLSWDLSGDCVSSDIGSTPDDGTNSIAAGDIEPKFESDAEESCTAKLSLERAQKGTIDSAFTEGGSIVAKQVRSDSFTSTP
jgi:hypothetical protein